MSPLTCSRCRLTYADAALARVPVLVAGAACPRCRNPLQSDQDYSVRAVRSAIGGRHRVPYSEAERVLQAPKRHE